MAPTGVFAEAHDENAPAVVNAQPTVQDHAIVKPALPSEAVALPTVDAAVPKHPASDNADPTSDCDADVGQKVLYRRMANTTVLFRESFSGGKTPEELAKLYDDWAPAYVRDTSSADYQAPKNTCEVFRNRLPAHVDPSTARILDCGCGTGNAAEFLCINTGGRPRFLNLHGLDFSRGMLQEAKKMPYVELIQGDVLKPLDIPDDHYDAMIAVGMFTSGNVGPEAWDQLLRIVKPHGIITASVQDHIYEPDGFPVKLRQLQAEKKLRVVAEEKVSTMPAFKTFAMVVTVEVL